MALQLFIQMFTDNPLSEAGTDTTTIKITGHGLETGDIIVNEDRRYDTNFDPCSRIVTKVDADTLTVSAITGQASGDKIRLYKYIDRTAYLKVGSFTASDRLDRRNDCNFRLTIPDSTYAPEPGQNVKVMYDSQIIFGGAIKTVKLKRIGVTGAYKLQADVNSQGFGHVPARRTIPANYFNKTSKEIVMDLVDNYLSQEGITYTAADMGNGATWDEYPPDFANNCISIKDILDEMASASGYKVYIDSERELHFISEDVVTNAPHVIKDADAFKDYRNVTIEKTLINYRNKQFVKGGADDFGDTIAVWAQNQEEILARQDVEGGSGVYGSIFEDTNISNTVELTAEAGTTTTNVCVTNHGLYDGDMVVNTSRNNAKRLVVVVNANNFTVTDDGINAHAIAGQTTGDNIVYYPDANVAAKNNIKRYGKVLPAELNFETGELGFRAGQKLTVNLAEFGMTVDETYLIEEVNFFDTEGINGSGDIVIRANIMATSRDASDFSTQHTENWIDTFAQFIGGGSTTGSKINITVGTKHPNNPKNFDLFMNTNPTVLSKTTTGTLTGAEADSIVQMTNTITQTLPAPSTYLEYKTFIFKNMDINTKTIGGTVDGVSNPTITIQYEVLRVYCDGTQWLKW